MSYDIYCYRSESGIPNQAEADAIVSSDTDKWAKKNRNAATKLAIVKALVAYNPRLIATDFKYGEVAKLTVDIIEKETNKFDHIEINTPDEDLYVRLIVYDNHVFITTNYGHRGDQATQLFRDFTAYINIIRETAGYLVNDPQTGKTFDPAIHAFDGLGKYQPTSKLVNTKESNQEATPIHATATTPEVTKKPWWKIW